MRGYVHHVVSSDAGALARVALAAAAGVVRVPLKNLTLDRARPEPELVLERPALWLQRNRSGSGRREGQRNLSGKINRAPECPGYPLTDVHIPALDRSKNEMRDCV